MYGVMAAVLVIGLLWTLLAMRANAYLWAAVMGGALLGVTFRGTASGTTLLAATLLYLVVASVVLVPALRRRWLTGPLMTRFRASLPSISDTEREALEAGTVGWEGEFFEGRPHWKRLHALTPPRLTAREQAFLDGPVQKLCDMLDDWEITDRLHDLPPGVWRYLKEQGFFGMIIPRQYGGLSFSAYAHSCVITKVASRSITAAVTVMVPNSLGPAKLLLHYGTEAQKNHYLPRLASGREIPCFALTAPEAGSDASAITDTGTVCRARHHGKDMVGIRLRWNKRYITLAPVATVLGLAFRLRDPEHLLGECTEPGITLALIPTDTAGVEIGARHCPLDIPFQNGPTRGHDVFIPLEWIIGGPAQAGHGWRMLMECLADGRAISLPALATGAGKLASRATGAYGAVRRQFKAPIGRFEGVAEALARIAGHSYVMEAARNLTAAALDAGERPAVASAILKYQLTERMRRVVDDAMDVHGGRGICLGPHNFLGRVYQAVPISITVEGANILTRCLIIFGQGAVRCHPYMLAEIRAAGHPDRSTGLRAFDRAIGAHLRLILGNAARALFHGLTGARFARGAGDGFTLPYYRQFTRMSAAFSLSADLAMLMLGGTLKRREHLTGRLADALSHLYLGTAVLKHYRDQQQPPADRPLVQWACEDCLYRTQQALIGLLDNFPAPWVGRLLRRWLFPLGAPYGPPPDAVGQQAAALLLTPGIARDRLTDGLYLPTDPDQPLAALDTAMAAAVDAAPALQALRKAMAAGSLSPGDPELAADAGLALGVIDAAQAQRIRTAKEARWRVIQVDDFPVSRLEQEAHPWQTGATRPGTAAQST